MEKKGKKILVLCPSPKGTAAAQRLKYEQYFSLLEEEGYKFVISSFQSERFWKIIHRPGYVIEKIFWTSLGYFRRFFDLIRAPFFDGVFVTLWVTPLGFPFFERILLLANKKIIYDIDDMIFLDKVEFIKKNMFQRLKGIKKPIVLMRYARYVIVCTPRLEEIALELNKYRQVIDISSTFNTNRFLPVINYDDKEIVTIGWTGTHSTLPFLEMLQPILSEINSKRRILLLVIANKNYEMTNVPTEFVSWNEKTEIEDLQRIDIGLYPIPMSEWSLGKSSLKALTYMSIGIPFVATAFGTNFRIMEDGVQGFLVKTNQEWVNRIITLIDNVSLRKKMGIAGRKRVEEQFSIKANFPKYLKVFKTVIPNS
ncbi:MAG: glycosyltransferase family 4 protein [Chitinophagaceae bacterium]|nr:glycosyltransferase family 4 protein [Chitinophagaceae bacterium]